MCILLFESRVVIILIGRQLSHWKLFHVHWHQTFIMGWASVLHLQEWVKIISLEGGISSN